MRIAWVGVALLAFMGVARAQARCMDGTLVGDEAGCADRGGVEARAAKPGEKAALLPMYPPLFCRDGTLTQETGAEACRGRGGLGVPDRRAQTPVTTPRP